MSDQVIPLGHRLALVGVYLHGASVVRGGALHVTPGESTVNSAVSRIELGEGSVVCYHEAAVETRNGESEIIVTVVVTFALVYSLAVGSEIDHAELQHYASTSGRVQVHPYIREYLAATLSRMGLPVFQLPLLEHGAIAHVVETPGATGPLG